MPNIATINGIDEDDIATHNGITAANVASKGGDTWEHLTAFGGGHQTATDLKTFFDTNFINSFAINSPTAGGNLILNGQNVGPYDYVLKRSDITLSSTPTSSDWFTTTKDTRSAIIGVAGNLTINSGAFLRPPDRKLFMAIYVDGNLTINSGGTISMTARGANHSGTGTSGGATTAREIRLATGTFGGISNPVVPAAGSAGGVGATGTSGNTNNWPTGGASDSPAATGGGTGGGGAGGGGIIGDAGGGSYTLGSGSAGTCFSSGCGGGGMYGINAGQNITSDSAETNGGQGGDSWIKSNGYGGPGAGNPCGVYAGSTGGGGAYPPGWHSSVPPQYTWNHFRNSGTVPGGSPYALPHHTAWNSGSTNMRGREAVFEGYENGTAGTLVIYVSGTLSGSGWIDSSGLDGGSDGGGGSGGGSITVFYNTDSSSITPRAPGQKGNAYNSWNGGYGGTGTARKLSGL